jgi:hypothetical protein
VYSKECAKGPQADRVGRGCGGLRGKGGPMWQTGPARPDPREDSNKSLIFEFQGVLEFGRTWRNSKKRFRRNLDMGIFPKFS